MQYQYPFPMPTTQQFTQMPLPPSPVISEHWFYTLISDLNKEGIKLSEKRKQEIINSTNATSQALTDRGIIPICSSRPNGTGVLLPHKNHFLALGYQEPKSEKEINEQDGNRWYAEILKAERNLHKTELYLQQQAIKNQEDRFESHVQTLCISEQDQRNLFTQSETDAFENLKTREQAALSTFDFKTTLETCLNDQTADLENIKIEESNAYAELKQTYATHNKTIKKIHKAIKRINELEESLQGEPIKRSAIIDLKTNDFSRLLAIKANDYHNILKVIADRKQEEINKQERLDTQKEQAKKKKQALKGLKKLNNPELLKEFSSSSTTPTPTDNTSPHTSSPASSSNALLTLQNKERLKLFLT